MIQFKWKGEEFECPGFLFKRKAGNIDWVVRAIKQFEEQKKNPRVSPFDLIEDESNISGKEVKKLSPAARCVSVSV